MTKYKLTIRDQYNIRKYQVQKSKFFQLTRRFMNLIKVTRQCENCMTKASIISGHGRLYCENCIWIDRTMPKAVCLDCGKRRSLICHSLNGKLGEIIKGGPFCHTCGHCDYVITH